MIKKYTNIAFISYKREDEAWAKWLQKKLEHYKLPTEIRKKNPDLEFYECPRYIFKDTTDLSGGVLAKAIKAGLDSSKFLIVICSPRAAKSEWVCKEVQDFINLGREEYIIPFIVDGEPHSVNAEKECFPFALKSLSGERELLGININENGRDSAAVKVVARLFDLKFDTLWNRFQREEKRKRRIIFGAFIFAILFLLCIIAGGAYAYNEIQRERDRVLQNHARMVAEKSKEMIAKGDVYNAIMALLNFVPQENTIPYIPEVDATLRLALDSLDSMRWTYSLISDNCYDAYFSNTGKYIIAQNEEKILILDTKSYLPITSVPKKEKDFYKTSLSKDDDTLFVENDDYCSAYFVPSGKMVKNFTNEDYANDSILLSSDFGVCMPKNSIVRYFPKESFLIYKKVYKQDDFDKEYTVIYNNLKTRRKIFERYDDNEKNLFVDPGWGVNMTSLSANNKYIAVSYHDCVDIIDLEQYQVKKMHSHLDDCDHYSEEWSFVGNDTLLHTSDFHIPYFYDVNSGMLLDSLNLPTEGIVRGLTFDTTRQNFLIVIDGKWLYMLKRNNYNVSNGFRYYYTKNKRSTNKTLVSNRFKIEVNKGELKVNDDFLGKAWTYSGSDGIKLVDIIVDKYLVAEENIDHGRGWEEHSVIVFDISSGVKIKVIPSDENRYVRTGDAFVLTGNNAESTYEYLFRSYEDVIKRCKEVVKEMKLTEMVKRQYYIE